MPSTDPRDREITAEITLTDCDQNKYSQPLYFPLASFGYAISNNMLETSVAIPVRRTTKLECNPPSSANGESPKALSPTRTPRTPKIREIAGAIFTKTSRAFAGRLGTCL